MIFVCGYPRSVGGASTELWHTVKLWRQMGLGVTLIPTWRADPAWRRKLAGIGCRTVECPPEKLDTVPGLAGGVVVSFCNREFLAAAHRFRDLGCRTIWLSCMNWLFPDERLHYRRYGPFDRHVFQSRYQREQLAPQLERFGYRPEQGRLVRGAFDPAEFPFRPRPRAGCGPFVIGRMSRAAPEKFSPFTWRIYGQTPGPFRARVLGFGPAVAERTGTAPPWVECLPEGSLAAAEFLSTLHAMVFAGGAAAENWPRAGLEAMAAGVPIVADNRGGWREMIRHGYTGFLCDTEEDFACHTAELARNEQLRMRIACQARRDLEKRLAEPGRLARQWGRLVDSDAVTMDHGHDGHDGRHGQKH